METAIGVAMLLLVGMGYAAGGLRGALTGFVAALGVGSGLQIARAAPDTGVSSPPSTLLAQRIGGAIAACLTLAAAVYGGWRMGWAWGLGGYAVGMLAATALRSAFDRAPQQS